MPEDAPDDQTSESNGQPSTPSLASSVSTIEPSSEDLSRMNDRVPTFQQPPDHTATTRCAATSERTTYRNGDGLTSSPPPMDREASGDQQAASYQGSESSRLSGFDWVPERDSSLASPSPELPETPTEDGGEMVEDELDREFLTGSEPMSNRAIDSNLSHQMYQALEGVHMCQMEDVIP